MNRKALETARDVEMRLQSKVRALEKERRRLLCELEAMNATVNELNQSKLESNSRIQKEREKLEISNRKSALEKRKCVKLLLELKQQFSATKNKHDNEKAMLNVEKEKIRYQFITT